MTFLRKHWLGVGLTAICLWLVVCTALIASAYQDAKRGRDQLRQLSASADVTSLASGEFETQLASATASMKSAHWKIGNPVVAPLRLIPYGGRQLSSAIAITNAVAVTGDAASDSLTRARALTDRLDTDRAGVLRELGEITAQADQRIVDLSFGPDKNLVAPLADARNEVTSKLSSVHRALSQASAGSTAMSELLDTDSRYLVVAANNGEMRAGAGMFLSAGILETGNGSLRLGDMVTVGEINAPASEITWPEDIDARWGWIGNKNDLRNLMMSPRFDQSAPLAAEIWEASGREAVDGVMVIDPILLQAILRANGPVQAGGIEVNADNVVQQLLVEQYRAINLSQSTIEAQASRRDGLSEIASQTFAALNFGTWDPVAMARQLHGAAQGRHVLVWAKDGTMNRHWQTAGVSGQMSTDSLMLSNINVGSNKVDQFLKTEAVLDQYLGANGPQSTVKVTITNNVPSSAPGYVLGPTPGLGLKRGEYSGLLTFSLPQDARSIRFDGDPALVALGSDGPNQTISTRVRIEQGESISMTLRFMRAATAQKTRIEPSARYPVTTWISGTEEWTDSAAKEFSINNVR